MLDKFVIAVVSPLGTCLLLTLLAALLAWASRRRAAWAVAVAAVVWLVAWSLPVTSHWVRKQVEAPYPALPVLAVPAAQAIVVLGGSVRPAHTPLETGGLPDLNESADRVWHAARLYHAGKAPLVLLTGGSDPSVNQSSEARAMQSFLVDLGVPVQATLLEEESRNTRQNAVFSARLLRERGISQVLLVTSAMHLRRARALFEAQGLQVVPVATDHGARLGEDDPRWLPHADALNTSAQALKEIVGRLAGR